MAQFSDRQRTRNAEIMAWAREEPWASTPRKKAVIPNLTPEYADATYMPEEALVRGQYFTPPAMAVSLIERSGIKPKPGDRIIDPAAGTGRLLAPLKERGATLFACELEKDIYDLGRKLNPEYIWYNTNSLDEANVFASMFDYVVMNPPFGIVWGTGLTMRQRETLATKSQHLFLELAIKTLKPGGQAVVLGPWNLFQSAPAKLQHWIEARVTKVTDLGKLVGDFTQKNGGDYKGFVFHRNGFDHAIQLEDLQKENQEYARREFLYDPTCTIGEGNDED